MKTVILNGERKNEKILDSIHEIVTNQLSDLNWDAKPFFLRELNITHCVGCFECWVKTPGICRFKDDAPQIAEAFINSNLLICITPVTFGGYSSELKKALDRIICLVSPFFMKIYGETHHKRRYEQYPSLMGIGVLPGSDPDSEKIFKTLVYRNSLNFHSPSHIGGVVLSNQEMKEKIKIIQSFFTAIEVVK